MGETLEEARRRLLTHGGGVRPVVRIVPGGHVLCLTRNRYGTYVPCKAKAVEQTAGGKVRVDLYAKGDEFRNVTMAALLYSDTCGMWDMPDSELRAWVKEHVIWTGPHAVGAYERPHALHMADLMDRQRLELCWYHRSFPYKMRYAGEHTTFNWPAHVANLPKGDTQPDTIGTPTEESIRSAAEGGWRVFYSRRGESAGTPPRRATKARTVDGILEVWDAAGFWTPVDGFNWVVYAEIAGTGEDDEPDPRMEAVADAYLDAAAELPDHSPFDFDGTEAAALAERVEEAWRNSGPQFGPDPDPPTDPAEEIAYALINAAEEVMNAKEAARSAGEDDWRTSRFYDECHANVARWVRDAGMAGAKEGA